MVEITLKAWPKANIVGEVHPKNEQSKGLITLTGITTSQVWKREKLSDTPAYCFLKTDEKKGDIPTIFRVKESYEQIKAKVKKHSCLQVEGTFANSEKSNRPSFTAYSYQILAKI